MKPKHKNSSLLIIIFSGVTFVLAVLALVTITSGNKSSSQSEQDKSPQTGLGLTQSAKNNQFQSPVKQEEIDREAENQRLLDTGKVAKANPGVTDASRAGISYAVSVTFNPDTKSIDISVPASFKNSSYGQQVLKQIQTSFAQIDPNNANMQQMIDDLQKSLQGSVDNYENAQDTTPEISGDKTQEYISDNSVKQIAAIIIGSIALATLAITVTMVVLNKRKEA
ncbi:hypothetical protein FWF48_02110 [Candidatus Saccharibacteria bacterium]|nr:hypothetical protein [Candidatus Saccharibacteria bacterium]